jgi:hypothetical protein
MRYVISFMICLGMSLAAWGQAPKLSVSVSSDTVLLGNYFELKFTIENTSASGFEPPSLHQFNVIGGPNTSTSFSIVNGQMSQSATYTYYLEPMDIGVYTIRPAYLTTGDVAIETPPIDILVVPNPQGIIQRPHAPGKRLEPRIAPKPADDEPAKPRRKF